MGLLLTGEQISNVAQEKQTATGNKRKKNTAVVFVDVRTSSDLGK